MTSTIVVADTSVLVNFLRVDRTDLLALYPRTILVTDHVIAEVTDAFSEQQARLATALSAGHITSCLVDDPSELELFLRLGPGVRLGAGECSAIAVAAKRKHALAIDDNGAVKRAFRDIGIRVEIIRTADLVVGLIRNGLLDLAEADGIKAEWERNHRFRLKVRSFADLL